MRPVSTQENKHAWDRTGLEQNTEPVHGLSVLIIYMKKFLHFDWLRAVQFLGNTVPKKEIQCKFL